MSWLVPFFVHHWFHAKTWVLCLYNLALLTIFQCIDFISHSDITYHIHESSLNFHQLFFRIPEFLWMNNLVFYDWICKIGYQMTSSTDWINRFFRDHWSVDSQLMRPLISKTLKFIRNSEYIVVCSSRCMFKWQKKRKKNRWSVISQLQWSLHRVRKNCNANIFSVYRVRNDSVNFSVFVCVCMCRMKNVKRMNETKEWSREFSFSHRKMWECARLPRDC